MEEQLQMLGKLKKQEEELREDLIHLEQQFTFKKEEYLKITGAIEALSALSGNDQEED